MSDPRHVVLCGVLVREGRVLLCHRRADRAWYPDVWDLPGGHTEAGESPQATLSRELREELGTEVRQASLLRREVTPEADLSFWLVESWTGTPANLAPEEHDEVAWFTLEEAGALRLADAFYPELLAQALGADSSRSP
ncbi:NUDIX domain-containing protein [Deinococcus sp. SDU3-2]|uniref:8-oxo-dGTP diphosphatase n=1 Tax=Deinococcus terrestris TaxID=2651870 RepID=A0A7X1NXX9_9DEIO|nr:NUDIX domain-containing protein [Deinococcus terrestris]MPY67838.1 NUDIX domain-containing protein [Deinococcus terrestris]